MIFVLSGPSGSGKTTLVRTVLRHKDIKDKFTRSVSLTTRPPRSGERDKRDYFFITENRFRQKLKTKKILEWTKYLGYYYATPKDFLEKELKRGKSVMLCLDLKGASRVKKLFPNNAVTIFIAPPSIKTLKKRIEGRCRQTRDEEIKSRLSLAKRELHARFNYDYSLVNNKFEDAVKDLHSIILSGIATIAR